MKSMRRDSSGWKRVGTPIMTPLNGISKIIPMSVRKDYRGKNPTPNK